MTQADAATVHKQVVVDAPIDRAFTVFTDRFGDFKPPEHNLLAAPIYAESPTRTRVELEHRHLDGTAQGGKPSATAWTAPRAGRCTWTGTPPW